MRRFFVLLKKEVKELFTIQLMAPILVMALVFLLLGKAIGDETKKSVGPQRIVVLDKDDSGISQRALQRLAENGFTVERYTEADLEEILAACREGGRTHILVIPSGFAEGLQRHIPQQLEAYSILRDLSLSTSVNSAGLKEALRIMSDSIGAELLHAENSKIPPELLKSPLSLENHVMIKERRAAVSPEVVIGFATSQTVFIPVILFVVIIFASQIIITAVANEKENKTLETLLTVPINRGAIVAAKMSAAGLMAFFIALVYMLGFRYYMNGISGGAIGEVANYKSLASLYELGLVLKPYDYVLQGLSQFFGILCALAIAFVLGSVADDLKSAQGLLTPLIFLVMIPYFLVIFLDINSVSPVMKTIIYAIPFTHPFIATPNLLLNNYKMVLFGLIYEIAFCGAFIYLATKLFSSDRLLTMRLRLKKRRI